MSSRSCQPAPPRTAAAPYLALCQAHAERRASNDLVTHWTAAASRPLQPPALLECGLRWAVVAQLAIVAEDMPAAVAATQRSSLAHPGGAALARVRHELGLDPQQPDLAEVDDREREAALRLRCKARKIGWFDFDWHYEMAVSLDDPVHALRALYLAADVTQGAASVALADRMIARTDIGANLRALLLAAVVMNDDGFLNLDEFIAQRPGERVLAISEVLQCLSHPEMRSVAALRHVRVGDTDAAEASLWPAGRDRSTPPAGAGHVAALHLWRRGEFRHARSALVPAQVGAEHLEFVWLRQLRVVLDVQ